MPLDAINEVSQQQEPSLHRGVAKITEADNKSVIDMRSTANEDTAKLLPDLTLLDDSATDTSGSDGLDTVVHQGPPPVEQTDWTIAVDLTANMNGEAEVGSERQLQNLLDLAQQTSGRDMTLVVAAAMNSPEAREGGMRARGEMPEIQQFVIRDGEIYQISSDESEGMRKDLENLFETAEQYAPSNHLGLIIQSHGNGNLGISGDAGQMSTAELNDTISDALKDSGHDKLDLLDFNACLMGDVAVLDAIANNADIVVASPEKEGGCNAEADGQNVSEVLTRALTDPDLSPEELAQLFIDVAKEGLNGTVSEENKNGVLEFCSGTPTLSSYDTSGEESLNNAINNLGRELTEALKIPESRDVVLEDINASHLFPQGRAYSQRDLGSFLDKLSESIQNGELSGDNSDLFKSINSTREAMDNTIVDYHGQEEYANLGGVSIYLPEQGELDMILDAGENHYDAFLDRLIPESYGDWREFIDAYSNPQAS